MLDIKRDVKAFIVDNLLMVGGDLAESASLQGQGAIDSTGVLELVAFLESRFGITIADDELRPENLDSVEAIEAYVRKKLVAPAL